MRFIFKLLAANPGAVIVQFIYNVSGVLMAPFMFIFPTTRVTEGSVFEWSTLVAMLIYALVFYGIAGLFGIAKTADTGEE